MFSTVNHPPDDAAGVASKMDGVAETEPNPTDENERKKRNRAEMEVGKTCMPDRLRSVLDAYCDRGPDSWLL